MSLPRGMGMVIATTIAVVTARGMVACGPELGDEVPDDAAERYAEAICAEYGACGCLGEGFADAASCRRAAEELFHQVESTPHVIFDEECFDLYLEHFPRRGCRSVFSEDPPEWFPCMPFRGTLARGAACESDPYEDGRGDIVTGPCEDGERCWGGRCGEPAPQVELGQPCGYGLGVRCGQGRYCGRDGTCKEQVALSEACDAPYACAEGAHNYCVGIRSDSETLGTCVRRLDVGQPCDPQDVGPCELGSTCNGAGKCADAWPAVCHVLTPRDHYDPREWVPEE